jgi:hypothetical protein
MTHKIQRGLHPGKRQLVEDETDEERAGLLEESASLKKLIADIKELASPTCDTEIKEHQMRIVEVILLCIKELSYGHIEVMHILYPRFLEMWR